MDANSKKELAKIACNVRMGIIEGTFNAKSGHPGGAMGGADFINVLYSEYLNYDPENPTWVGRDRFFLDPGHMAPMLYAQLALIGKFSLEEIAQLRQWGSPTTGHPEFEIARGIENTSGPLGQGHTFAVGAAIAAKFLAARTGNPTFAKETIYAYPNPVRPEYSGEVIIGGLEDNSIVWITDASGNLVFKGRTIGGSISWDCKNRTGQDVTGGVYMVLVSNEDSDNPNSVATKILVVR